MNSANHPARRSFLERFVACNALAACIALAPVGVPAAVAVETPDAAKNHTAMNALKDALAKLGKARLDGDKIVFGSTAVNGDFSVVDAIKAAHGCSATIFMRKGDAFVRVSTNVIKDGNRALGTPLDPSGPAFAALSKGKAFYGIVDILGKLYDTGYEPILGAGGNVIGAAYVGFALE